MLETNLFGAFYTLKAVTRPMLAPRAAASSDHQRQRPGRPDGPGQLLVSQGRPDRPDQGRGARAGSRGITVNAVAPGFVLTELTQDLNDDLKAQITERTPLGRFGTTEEIAYAVAFLASDEAAYITGQVLAVDGGLVMM